MCDVIGPWKPPHFSALPLLACPRDARPHEPLCCCRCSLSLRPLPSRKSPPSVLRLRLRCCELLSSTTHTPPVCRHHRDTRTPLPPSYCTARCCPCPLASLPLPRRQHSGDLSRRSSSLHGVSISISISISIAPGSWPEKARPRPLPASLHQSPSEQRQRQELPRTAAPPKTRHNTTALYRPRTAAHCQALACVARTTLAAPSLLEHLRVRRP
jgi:hypothetical protein